MLIYMTHPLHGRMPVYSRDEVDRAKVHGRTEDAPAKPEPVQSIVTEPKRRGRPPKVAQ